MLKIYIFKTDEIFVHATGNNESSAEICFNGVPKMLMVLYVLEIISLVIVCAVVIKTRNVPSQFNEAKIIAKCIFCIILIKISFLPFYLFDFGLNLNLRILMGSLAHGLIGNNF